MKKKEDVKKKAAPKKAAKKKTTRKKAAPKKAAKKDFNFKEWLPWILMGIIAAILLLVLLGQNGENSSPTLSRADVPTDVPSVQDQPRTVEIQEGNVVFCFRLDGREDRHLPDLVPGITGSVPNNVAGSNFSLPVTNDHSLSYGVTDEYVFVKSSYLEQFNYDFVELKAGWTGWAPVAGDLVKIDGERAYIFRFHSVQ